MFVEGIIIVYLIENNIYIIVFILGDNFNFYFVRFFDNYRLIVIKLNNVIVLFFFG